MASSRNQLIELIEQDSIPVEKIDDALVITKVFPESKAWLVFINQVLLWIGGLSIAFAVMFFIAYNWDAVGHFAKFGMVEALIILAILVYCKLDARQVGAKVSLLMASIFLGVLLALYGQIYQTGADPWQLFFNWALLMLPWALIARFPAIWVLWLILINLSIILYFQIFPGAIGFIFGSDDGVFWALFVINTFALIIWELLSRQWQWLSERWAVRLLATGGGMSITWLVIYTIFDDQKLALWPGVVWIIWLVVMYFVYRKHWPDLFMLTGVALSSIIVITSFVSKHVFASGDNAGDFFLIALLIIGMGAGAAAWLRSIQKEWHHADIK